MATSDQVRFVAKAAAWLYADEFPGQPADDAWTTAAWEIDTQATGALAGADGAQYALYEASVRAEVERLRAEARTTEVQS